LDVFWLVEHPDFTVCKLGSLLNQVLNKCFPQVTESNFILNSTSPRLNSLLK